jgi:hypothetical protein
MWEAVAMTMTASRFVRFAFGDLVVLWVIAAVLAA